MGDTLDAFTTVRIMGPATQAKSPASGRGDEESRSETESQMSVSLHSFGDPQSLFSGLACILSLYNRGPSHCQAERTELKRGLSKDSQLIRLPRRTPRDTSARKNVKSRMATDSRGMSHRKRRRLSLSEN